VRRLEVNTMAAQWTQNHCGRSNLDGKQTWGPEHKEISAATKSHFAQKLLVRESLCPADLFYAGESR
jgi:hypothetical protein